MDWFKRKLLENNQKYRMAQQENETLELHIEQKQIEMDQFMIELNQRQIEIDKLRRRFTDNQALMENVQRLNLKINERIKKITD
jgi:predicted  nucleic acid-binding Zn-ribbon protein